MVNEIEKRKQRWLDLYKEDGRRKIVYIVDFEQGNGQGWPLLWPQNKESRIEWAWQNYNAGLERIQWLKDDYIPYLSVISGTEIFAEAFGCKVFRPIDNMPCAIPYIKTVEDAVKVKVPKLEDSSLVRIFEIADELKKRGGKDALLKLPDLQSPMDIVAQMWDKSELFVAMIEEPEAVKEVAAKAKELLISFLDEWFQRYGTEYIAHHPDYYMKGGITLSVDEVGNVNSDMFTEFFEEELNELSMRYGGIGIHCCADSVHQWEKFSKIHKLKLLNLYRPTSVLEDAYEYFSGITAQWHFKMEHNIPEVLVNKRCREYPEGSRIVIVEPASTKEKSIEIAEYLKGEYR